VDLGPTDGKGLLGRLPGPKGPHPNRVSEEVKNAILEHSLDHPHVGFYFGTATGVATGAATGAIAGAAFGRFSGGD